jgi:hypothetical protein
MKILDWLLNITIVIISILLAFYIVFSVKNYFFSGSDLAHVVAGLISGVLSGFFALSLLMPLKNFILNRENF